MENAINKDKVFFQQFKIELVYTTMHVQIQYFEACNNKRSKRSKHADNYTLVCYLCNIINSMSMY